MPTGTIAEVSLPQVSTSEPVWPETVSYNDDGDTLIPDEVVSCFDMFGELIYQTGFEKGFWDSDMDCSPGMKISLMHSELSEALEAIRKGNPASEKIPDHSLAAEEFADAIIRILDFGIKHRLDIGSALMAKALYNKTRPYRHGKKF